MGGFPILLLLGLVQLSSPMTIINRFMQDGKVIHQVDTSSSTSSKLRGGGLLYTHDEIQPEGQAGDWSQKLMDQEWKMLLEESDDFLFLDKEELALAPSLHGNQLEDSNMDLTDNFRFLDEEESALFPSLPEGKAGDLSQKLMDQEWKMLLDESDDLLFLDEDELALAPSFHSDRLEESNMDLTDGSRLLDEEEPDLLPSLPGHRRLQQMENYPQYQTGYPANGSPPQAEQRATEQKPIMYTFHTPIAGKKETGMTDESDQTLLQAWGEEWTRHGWEPRVIGIETAQQHPDFLRLNFMLDKVGEMKLYERYCFLRYLAMAVVSGGWMSDYDTFPLHHFDATLPSHGRLTIHEYSRNGGVPDLVSGSEEEFTRIANLLIENAVERKDQPHWSDMFALHDLYIGSGGSIYNRPSPTHVVPGQVVTKQKRAARICNRTNGKYAIHFSHYAMEFGVGAGPERRAEIAQAWLKGWREMCLNQATNSN